MAESQPVSGAAQAPRLVFGVYPGGLTGTESEPQVGTADDPERTEQALARLQPEGRPFLIRGYVHYTGSGRAENLTPAGMTQYLRGERRLDLVLCFRSAEGDLKDWTQFVRAAVRELARTWQPFRSRRSRTTRGRAETAASPTSARPSSRA
jgi:hypothetical protein